MSDSVTDAAQDKEQQEEQTPPEQPEAGQEPEAEEQAPLTGDAPSEEAPPDSGDEEEEDEPRMTFLDHLSELRIRLTRSIIAALVGMLACYGFSKQIFEYLMMPLVSVFPEGTKFIYTALPEAFFTYIKVSLVAGVLLTSPYIFYQVWMFIAPGLYDEERKYMIPIAFFSALFFVSGAGFGYMVVFPFAFEFFMSFTGEYIQAMPSLKEYLGFSLKLLFAFGLTFELPLFVFFLARLGIVTAEMMRKFRKYAFLCSFVLSALLTPPDVISQCLMAGPLIILFEISIYVAQIFGRKKRLPPEEEQEEEQDDEEQDKADDERAETNEALAE